MADTTFQWIDANGAVTDLNDWVTTWATQGQRNFFNVPFQLNSYEVPLTPGEAFSSVDIRPRQVDLPVLVACANRTEYIQKMRTLVSALNPDKGAGRLRVGHEVNSARELNCRYVSGLEGAGSAKGSSPASAMAMLSFRASDPFWYELYAQTASYVLGAPVLFFPFFPLRLSQSGIFTETTITNNGDHIAWPVWTLTGPADSVVLRNLTTGYALTANITIAAGNSAVIDTRPGIKTVQMNGLNYFYTLAQDSTLWGLARGVNSLQLILNNADGNSKIELSYKPPYFSY